MMHFLINGIETTPPVAPESSVTEFFAYLRGHFNSPSSVISSVWINGMEISESDEKNLGAIPVSQLDSVEIITAHPREIAEDTLQSLLLYTETLSELSTEASTKVSEITAFGLVFARLLDGLSTMADAVHTVKTILRIGSATTLAIVEADLLSILKDTLKAQDDKQIQYLQELLRDHLPANLKKWRTDAIPALIRSRDS